MANENDQHELLQALKNLASELGRTPTRDEFNGVHRGNKFKTTKLFGGYVPLCAAAGLDNNVGKKISNKIFERDLERHLEEYNPTEYKPFGPFPTMAIISDIHWPFENAAVIQKFIQYVSTERPEWVIIDGDAWDFYSHSKYPKSHNVFTPRQEEDMARKKNEGFWAAIHKASPKSKCVQLLGNHDARPLKRVLEQYPEAEDWIKDRMSRMFTFEDVRTIMDPREELIVGEVLIFHGYLSKLGAHRDFTMMNSIVGHTHKGGVVYRQVHGKVLFELNCGIAGDPQARGLTYTPQRITAWTPGFGAITKYGPMFIPL